MISQETSEMEMKETEAQEEPEISVTENADKPSIRNIIQGTVLAFTSGLLFTANHVIIQQFDLQFADVTLVRYVVQIIVLLSIIRIPICY